MTIKASGRSALILTAGLLVFFAGPASAATGTGTAAASSKSDSAAPAKPGKSKHSSRAQKKVARSADKDALKPAAANKPAADDEANDDATIPPSVANANAQLTAADTPSGSAKAMSARASDILQATPDGQAADSQVVNPDQLNDLDRALQDGKPAQASMKLASVETPAAPAAPVAASNDDNSTWDKTSLIGKVFIAFGGLLTLASAARMFMA